MRPGRPLDPLRVRPWLGRLWVGAVIAAAMAWMAYLLLGQRALAVPWTLQLLLPICALLAAGSTIIHRQYAWARGVRRVRRLLPRIVDGHEPIGSLARIGGPISELTPLLGELLHTLRRKSADVSTLNSELSRRVASRTDVLQRAIGSLREQARRDPLTGLFNRRALDQVFAQLLDRSRAAGQDLCVLMGDIDHFKRLNDTLGHAEGDAFLRAVGQLIRSSLRLDDVAFRCGGDEFLILLPHCAPTAAQTIAQRLQGLVDALAKPLKLAPSPRLALGLGALSQVDEPTAAGLIRQADVRLYADKHRGDLAA